MPSGLPHEGRNFLHTATGLLTVCPFSVLCLSCPYPCLSLCLSRGAVEAEFVISFPLLFPGKDSTAELSIGGHGSQRGCKSGHEVVLGCREGMGQRGSPWAGGTERADTHLVSIMELCEDAVSKMFYLCSFPHLCFGAGFAVLIQFFSQ